MIKAENLRMCEWINNEVREEWSYYHQEHFNNNLFEDLEQFENYDQYLKAKSEIESETNQVKKRSWEK